MPEREYANPRFEAPGYVFRGERVDGYRDRRDVPANVRRQIARWAAKAGTADEIQLRLAQFEEQPVRDELLELAEADDNLLCSAGFDATWAELSEEEKVLVLRPEGALDRDLEWPLRVSDMAALTRISANVLRDWDSLGILRPVRSGSGKYRGYFRSHLAQALALKKLQQKRWSRERIRGAVIPETDPAGAVAAGVRRLVAERERILQEA